MASFAELVVTYKRLKAAGITPFTQLNHRFTTSLYYHDPDGNKVELSVDNFATKEECSAFVRGKEMAEIGRATIRVRLRPGRDSPGFIIKAHQQRRSWRESACPAEA